MLAIWPLSALDVPFHVTIILRTMLNLLYFAGDKRDEEPHLFPLTASAHEVNRGRLVESLPRVC